MTKTIRTLFIAMLTISAGLQARSNAQSNSQSHSKDGAVFVMTNAAHKNEIIAYKRNADGSLNEIHRFPTGGRGSGGNVDPLGSQGSLTLTRDHSLLLAVNAGSGEISVFRVHGTRLDLTDVVPCGGSEPVSVSQRGQLVYVANAGGNSNVVGFRLGEEGKLKQIRGAIAFLSASNSGPGSVSISPDGHFVLVTEKVTNNIDAFPIRKDGTLGAIVITPSVGPGAFALSFAPNGAALVSETGPAGGNNASAISSYSLHSDGKLSVISASVPTMGAATCWQAITPDGKFVYTDNTGTSTISGFSIGNDGALTPLAGTIVATLPDGSINLDMALSGNGKFLYTLDTGTGKVSIFSTNTDGTLNSLGEVGGVHAKAGFNGIAAI